MSNMTLSLLIQAKDQATQTLNSIGKSLGGLGGSFGKFGLLAKGSLVAGAIGLAKLADSSDQATSSIIKLTGATADQARAMTTMAHNINAVVPQSLGDVATAIGEINTRLDLTGDALQDTSKLFLDFARVTNTDVSTAIRGVSRLMKDAGIDARFTSDMLDVLTVAGQKTGISVGNLSETVVNYGVQMRALGFDVVESIALISQFEKEGVATGKMMSGLSIALANMARAGIADTATAFKMLTGEIEATGEIGDAVRQSMELFGTRAGPDLALALQEGRFNIEELTASLMDSEGALQMTAEASLTAREKTSMLWATLKTQLQPITDLVVKSFHGLLQAMSWLIELGPRLKRAISNMANTIATTLNARLNNAINSTNQLLAGLGKLTGINLGQIRGIGDAVDSIKFGPQAVNLERMNHGLDVLRGLSSDADKFLGGLGSTAGDTAETLNDVFTLGGSGGGAGRAVRDVEEATEAMMQSNRHATQIVHDRIKAVEKERDIVNRDLKRAYESVNGMIRQGEDNIKRMTAEVLGLQQEIAQISQSATTGVATEVVRMEQDLAGLKETIHDVMMGGSGDLQELLNEKSKIEREIQQGLQHTTQEELERARMIASETSIQRILRERDERIEAIQEEIKEKEEQINKELQAVEHLSNFKEQAEKAYLQLFRESMHEQETLYDRLISKAEQLQQAQQGGGISLSGGVMSGGGGATSQTNNISINMGGVTVSNEADENRLVNKIKNALSRETRDFNQFGIIQ